MIGEPDAELDAARRRHPTALWVPDLEEMRRRLQERTADAVASEAHLEDEGSPA